MTDCTVCNKQMYHGTLQSKTNTKLFFCFVFTGNSETTHVVENTKTIKKPTVKDNNNKTKTKKASEFLSI